MSLSGACVLSLCLTALPPQQPPAVRVDAYGDPLPKHALLRIGTVRFTHQGRIRATFTSPDSHTVMAVDEEGMVRTWEVASGKELSSVAIDADRLGDCFALSPDRKLLAGPKSSGMRLWDSATGKTKATLEDAVGHWPRTLKPAFSLDGKTIIGLAAPGQLGVWDTTTGKKTRSVVLEKPKGFKGPPETFLGNACLAFSQDAMLVALDCGGETEVCIWSTTDGKLVQRVQGFPDRIGMFRFSPDGKLIAIGGADDRVRVWQVASGKLLGEYEKYSMYDFAFLPGAKIVLRGGWGAEFHIYDINNGMRIPREFQGSSRVVIGGEFEISPDGKFLIVCPLFGSINYHSGCSRIFIWDIATGKPMGKGHGAPIPIVGIFWRGVHYAPDFESIFMSNALMGPLGQTDRYRLVDGKVLGSYPGMSYHPGMAYHFGSIGFSLVTLLPGQIAVWDIATKKALWKHDQISGLLFRELSADGTLAVFESDANALHVADAKTGKVLKEYQPLPFKEGARAFSSSLDYVAISKERAADVAILDWKTGTTILTLKSTPTKKITRFGFSPDSKYVFGMESEHGDDRFVLWHLPSGTRDDRLPRGSLEGFSPDGSLLSLRTEQTLVVWDIRNRTVKSTLPPTEQPGQQPELTPVISHDNRMIATVKGTHVTVWEISTGKIRRHFDVTPSRAMEIQFSPDNRTLMTVSSSSVLIWDLTD